MPFILYYISRNIIFRWGQSTVHNLTTFVTVRRHNLYIVVHWWPKFIGHDSYLHSSSILMPSSLTSLMGLVHKGKLLNIYTTEQHSWDDLIARYDATPQRLPHNKPMTAAHRHTPPHQRCDLTREEQVLFSTDYRPLCVFKGHGSDADTGHVHAWAVALGITTRAWSPMWQTHSAKLISEPHNPKYFIHPQTHLKHT